MSEKTKDDLPSDWFDDTDDNLGQRQQFEWSNIMLGYAKKLAVAGLEASPALWDRFGSHLDKYQRIDDPDIAVVLDVDAIKNRIYREMEEGEMDVISGIPVTAGRIVTIVEYHIPRSPSPKQAKSRAIIPMKESQRPDQWYDIIKAAKNEFEAENGHTPNKNKLWWRLVKNSPKAFVVVHKNSVLTNSDGKCLDLKNFTARYKDYFGIVSE